MKKVEYPLEAALRVRETNVDRAARELAEKERAREVASRETRAAEDARKAKDTANDALREHERDALARGELRAADLMRGDAWEMRARSEQETLAKAEEAARRKVADAERDELAARHVVVEKRGEAKVIERDREAWNDAQKKARDKEDEESASEAWRPKAR